MEENLDPGVMENALEIIQGINARLSPETLKLLATVSKRAHHAVKSDVNDALFWKSKLENIVNLELPWRGSVQYWRTMYDNYKSTPVHKLYESGRYEHVYIANRLNKKGNLQRAIYNATVLGDIDGLKLLFKDPSAKIHVYGYKQSPIIYAIEHQNDVLVKTLLELSQNNSINETVSYEASAFEEAAALGRIDYMAMINDKYPVKEALHTTRRVFKSSALINLANRADVIKYFLSLKLECPYDINDYLQRHNFYSIPIDEIKIMLESECVNLNSSSSLYITSEAGLYLYKNNKSPLHKSSDLIWMFIVDDPEILDDALSYHVPDDVMTYIQSAFNMNNGSFAVMMKHLQIDANGQVELLTQYIGNIALAPLKYIYINSGMNMMQLETLVFKHLGSIDDKTLKSLHALGCSFNRIGQMLVFHVTFGISTMVAGGLSLDRIGPIAIKNILVTNAYHGTIEDILKGMNTIDTNEMYLHLASTPSQIAILQKYKLTNPRGITASPFTLLDTNVDWYSSDYSWIDRIHYQPAIAYSIGRMKEILMIQIIGRIARGSDEENLRLWLKLATELKLYVDVSTVDTILTITIGDTITVMSHNALKTKYHGLDMFAEDGTHLTTIEHIRKRRVAIFQ